MRAVGAHPRRRAGGKLRVAARGGGEHGPLLHTGDSVLVQVGNAVARDTVVLARVPDAGYVVKRVARVTRAELELQSLNDAFPPIVVPRDERTVVGTVVLRWCPHARR